MPSVERVVVSNHVPERLEHLLYPRLSSFLFTVVVKPYYYFSKVSEMDTGYVKMAFQVIGDGRGIVVWSS